MQLKKYTVTELAGSWVAGVRVPADKVLNLSDEQAEHELRLGTIALAADKKTEKAK